VLDGLPRATLVEIEDGDHGFRVPKRHGTEAEIRARIAATTVSWLDGRPPA
jgi:hypothetical protein